MFSIFKSEDEVLENFKNIIERIANESIASRDQFSVAFSGGSLGKYLCSILPKVKTDWTKWVIFFCDERFVPENDSESTFGFYKANLLPLVPLTEQQFMTIDVTKPIEEVAKSYEQTIREKLKEFSSIPSFDLLLLGVGPDGHTASLFPGHELLDVKDRIIAYITDSPKPPPQRITMTFPLINNARYSIFAVPGSGKSEIIKNIFVDKVDLPAARVKAVEKVYWLLDQASATHIK